MKRVAITIVLPLFVLTSCLEVVATHPPVPTLPAEQVPAPPPSKVTLIWQPGHYDWDGSHYAWVPGEWIERAGHGTLWQDGFWRSGHGEASWVPGHWL
jgi:hypothetical protein